MGGPLAIGLGVVFASSMASMFLPATTALGAGSYYIQYNLMGLLTITCGIHSMMCDHSSVCLWV